MSETIQEAPAALAGPTAETYLTRAYAAPSATAPLAPATIPRRVPGPRDVQIDVLFCGVCHSDLHQVRDEWKSAMPTVYPCVPGHEIVGRVVAVGRDVRGFKEGDLAAVGCLVDSCRTCAACLEGQEQFCEGPATFTYNAPDVHLGGVTYGGYSESLVVDEAFALRVPNGLDPAGAAPLLCAGITTYSPLRHWNVREGQKVGVVGLGGLGHMAVKLADAFGAQVVVFTTSPGKAEDAARLGARDVVVSTRPEEMQQHLGSFDFILDTVSAGHELNPYLDLLKRNGTLTMVGAPEAPLPVSVFSLLFGRRRLAGSIIGGIRETQEMLDFCADRGLTADIEQIPIWKINEAFDRLLRGDVKYRFVIDMASLR
ncbi:MAG TPA: NAD(P)-dependent alcohol dehydrogenase [Thermoanaerobaculia bacterium]|nr:NAD(P)-dependent alcohol dehydrogenase [Thermoanaerobaculia bacterium]